MYKIIKYSHNIDGGYLYMKDKECNCCEDAKFGVAYIDPESGLLCSKIDTGMKLPKGKKVLAPRICTKCGNTEWKTIDN